MQTSKKKEKNYLLFLFKNSVLVFLSETVIIKGLT